MTDAMTADSDTLATRLERALAEPQARAWETRAEVSADTWEVSGIGVPFGQVIELWWGRETFAPDCQFDGLEDALLMFAHRDPIGRLVESTRTAEGLRIRASISQTDRGREARTLALDGVLARYSIGFQPVEYLTSEDDLVTHTRVRVREFSLVPFPAYDGAEVTDVRHAAATPTALTTPRPTTNLEATTMTDTATLTRDDLDTFRTDMQREFQASLAELGDRLPAQGPTLGGQWRSAADFLRAVADGDQTALEFHRAYAERAYAGATAAMTATPATWVGEIIRLVDERRPQLNSFTRDVLPASGMQVEYARLKADATQVTKHTEGEPLAFGKVELETANADVETYGGYTTLSLAAIKRATTAYLATALRAMDLRYAKATEAAFKAVLSALITAQAAAGNKTTTGLTLPNMTLFKWLDAILDAAEVFDGKGYAISGLKVSKDVFQAIYGLKDSAGAPLLKIASSSDSVNQAGTFQVSRLTGQLADVQVELVNGWAAGTASFYDSEALTTWEEPGAPLMLQDQAVINLAANFSKFGSLAIGTPHPAAVRPLNFAAA